MKNLFQKFFGFLSKNSTQKDRTKRNVEIGRHLRQKVKGFDPRRFGRALYDHDETEFELESRNKILDIKDDLIGLTSYQKMNKIIVALGEERRTSCGTARSGRNTQRRKTYRKKCKPYI